MCFEFAELAIHYPNICHHIVCLVRSWNTDKDQLHAGAARTQLLRMDTNMAAVVAALRGNNCVSCIEVATRTAGAA